MSTRRKSSDGNSRSKLSNFRSRWFAKARRQLCLQELETRHLLAGPYAPAASELGTTAIAKDSVNIEGWASAFASYNPGTDVSVEFQTPNEALGPAEGTSGDVVSLGRGGEITLTFDAPIRNGLGPDFAVFENSFSDTFLEFSHVEVSSNGTSFFRFDSDSLTEPAVGEFGSVDTTNVNNLAGKFRQGFGTPFDLEELVGVSASLDVDAVTHVRIIDVVGDGNDNDADGDPIFDPFPTSGSAGFDLDAVGVLNQDRRPTDIVGFEDLSLSPESSFSGPVSGGTSTTGPFGDTVIVGDFMTETLSLENRFSQDFGSWSGFAYSNRTDTTTPGFANQFSSFAGGGANDSENFGVGFVSPPSVIRRDAADVRLLDSVQITNTTYTALSMAQGDDFAKKFGGPTGNDPDFLLLTITGKDAADDSIGSVDFYLADFRFADNSLDYIVDTWQTVDLSSIASASSLEFTIDSSDVGDFGINTPTYFAIDDIQFQRPALRLDIEKPVVVETDRTDATHLRVTRIGVDTASPMQVGLSHNGPDLVSIPASVTIDAGQTFADFTLDTIDDLSAIGVTEITISATFAGFDAASAGILVQNNDLPPLRIDPVSFSESDSGAAVDFEDAGARLGPESFYNGSDLAGGFVSRGVDFANDFNETFGSWAGWSFSNQTDTTTAGFLNQYSSFVGNGAGGSDTYGVANTFGSTRVTRSEASQGFESIAITNTTYAALSMLQGDAFAKKFGGESGDDPDFFLLTIEGFDADDLSIGTIDFYLADFRFADNSMDYIVDQWTTVDLSTIASAVSLGFSLDSSDIGDFGMNTPAYFAADDLRLVDDSNPQITVRRGQGADDGDDLVVDLVSDDASVLVVPESATIPAGMESVAVPVRLIDDALVDGSSTVTVSANAEGHAGANIQVEVTDDEIATLTTTVLTKTVDENGGLGQVVLHRNTADISGALAVNLFDGLTSTTNLPSTTMIPAGQRSVVLDFSPIDNMTVSGDRTASIEGTSDGFASNTSEFVLADDDEAGIVIDSGNDPLSLTEAADGLAFGVSLSSQPLSDVFIELVPESHDVRTDVTELSFSTENWDQPQIVTVSGSPDLEEESLEMFVVTAQLNVANSEPTYRPPSETIEVSVIDHQPSNLTLREEQGSLLLTDTDSGVLYLSELQADGIDVVASDQVQSVVIESLASTNGQVTVDVAGGDDVVTLKTDQFASIAGGAGYDLLKLDLEEPIELVDLLENAVSGFEQIDVLNTSGASVSINLDELDTIVAPGESLLVRNESDEQFVITGSGVSEDPELVDNEFAQVVRSGDATIKFVVDSAWQNVISPHDVDGSGRVSARDALIVINHLPELSETTLPEITSLEVFDGFFVDVSGDGRLSASDALQVINELVRQFSEPEGESNSIVANHDLAIRQMQDDEEQHDQTPTLF